MVTAAVVSGGKILKGREGKYGISLVSSIGSSAILAAPALAACACFFSGSSLSFSCEGELAAPSSDVLFAFSFETTSSDKFVPLAVATAHSNVGI